MMMKKWSINWSRLAFLSLLLGTFLTANLASADEQHLIKVHKQSYTLELFEEGNAVPLKVYGVAVAKNPGDKQMTGDNRTPTSWGSAVAIPARYAGAAMGVPSTQVPFVVEEICDASFWTQIGRAHV